MAPFLRAPAIGAIAVPTAGAGAAGTAVPSSSAILSRRCSLVCVYRRGSEV